MLGEVITACVSRGKRLPARAPFLTEQHRQEFKDKSMDKRASVMVLGAVDSLSPEKRHQIIGDSRVRETQSAHRHTAFTHLGLLGFEQNEYMGTRQSQDLPADLTSGIMVALDDELSDPRPAQPGHLLLKEQQSNRSVPEVSPDDIQFTFR